MIEGTYISERDGFKGLPTNGEVYKGDVRMRLRYNPNARNGTYAAMDILHRDFMEYGRTALFTDNGYGPCVVAFRGEAFVVAEGHAGVFDYHMTDAIVIVCRDSDEYKGPGISQDDYDEAEFVINPNTADELRMTWFAPE